MELIAYIDGKPHEYISILGQDLRTNDYIEIAREYNKVLSVESDSNYTTFKVSDGYYDLLKKGRYSVYRIQ